MLSKEDFMKICGVAEGIRMFYKIYSGFAAIIIVITLEHN